MIYLASPYSHPSELIRSSRYHRTQGNVARLLDQGLHVFSPIVYAHPVAVQYKLQTDYQFWAAFNDDILSRCDKMLVLLLSGHAESRGIAHEREVAAVHGIPVEEIMPL